MSDTEVIYSDVKFVKTKGNKNTGTLSSPDGSKQADAVGSRKEATEGFSGPQQEAASKGGSKVTPARVAIVILSVLLAVAVAGLVYTSREYTRTMGRLQQLTEKKTCPAFVNTTTRCWNCGDGWEQFEGQCYYFSNITMKWQKAREMCQERGGDLVRINSSNEQSFLNSKVREKMNEAEDKFWIGLTDEAEEGRWLWVDGSPLDDSLEYWSGGEPDNWRKQNENGENCARMGERKPSDSMKTWFDNSCSNTQKSICWKPGKPGHEVCFMNL